MEEIKLTIVGDIMCEPLMMKAARTKNDYDFSGVFAHVRSLFDESDFVIGNLETPFAGLEARYARDLFSFNAPDQFALAVKRAGIDLVLTANNHCMDRGFDGLLRTVDMLDRIQLDHTGTYRNVDSDRVFYKRVKDRTIAVVSYTYGANYSMHRRPLTREQEGHINLLRPYTESSFLPSAPKSLLNRIRNKAMSTLLKPEQIASIKKKLGMTYNSPRRDDNLNKETLKPYLERLREDVRRAKDSADCVLFCPHIGGQFNIDPGLFTEYIVQKAVEYGVDLIVASHPHIVQSAAIVREIPCFFSLGNFSMSPNSSYLLHEHLPDYGLAVHAYMKGGEINRITFSILKIIENKNELLTVYSAEEYTKLPEAQKSERFYGDVAQIYETVTGKTAPEDFSIQREYDWFSKDQVVAE